MKKIFILAVVFYLTFVCVQAQNTYLWPISGAKPGTGIISQPQSYIDKELNYAELFIAAPEGTMVVSPVDGTITGVAIRYFSTLESCWGSRVATNFDTVLMEVRKDLDKQYSPQYVSGGLSIRCLDGNILYINGLTGDQIFKTGQKITRGTPIGRVGYSYGPLKVPSIKISIDRNGKIADPMTPFGLKTTFIAPAAVKPILSLTKQQLKEDFLLYMDVLKECYPALYDVITPEELEQYIQQTKKRIDARAGNWSYKAATELITEAVAKIHDSHIYMHFPGWYGSQFKTLNQARISIGWINDTLICRNAAEPFKHLMNRPVKSINGMTSGQMKQRLVSQICSYDAGVKSYIDCQLAYGAYPLFCASGTTTFDYNMNLVMADNNEVVQVSAAKLGTLDAFLYNMRTSLNINNHKEGYKTQMLNDSTAYIGISSFQLHQMQVEEIAHFIDSIAKVPHLIIDVRNNGGGDAEVLSKLYTYIAGEPMTLHGYSRVNKQGGYKSFAHSLNRLVEDSLFADYKPEPGKEGFYSRSEEGSMVRADSAINYKGKVYVLTNENSISAATLFPALLVRNHRGVVVGRETRTAYHFMNALRFASIQLPHSTLTINVPLVYCCFDTVVNKRVPYGRGVLPDYEVPITVDELAFKNGDAILNYTLQLIKEGRYLSAENPFESN